MAARSGRRALRDIDGCVATRAPPIAVAAAPPTAMPETPDLTAILPRDCLNDDGAFDSVAQSRICTVEKHDSTYPGHWEVL